MAKTQNRKSDSAATIGFEANFGREHADTFRRDLHPELRADYVLANGRMSAHQSGEGEIRKSLIEAGLADGMVALPGQIFAKFGMN
jgi:type I restriction enzyme M protein